MHIKKIIWTHGPRVVLSFYGLWFAHKAIAQAEVKINCLQPFELEFSKSAPLRSDKWIRYNDHDDHTFWYKIKSKDSEKFSYRVLSLDDQRNFDIYFYQYNGNSFCRNLIQDNLELIAIEDLLDFKAQKDSYYYLGIYPLFPNGCGHKIEFKYGDKVTVLTSENSLSLCVDGTQEDTEEASSLDGKVAITGRVLDGVTGNAINASLVFSDPFTRHQVRLRSSEEVGFEAFLFEDGDYKVKVESFGYKELVTAISPSRGDVKEFELKWSDQKEFILENVYFYPNTYALKVESEEELEKVYSFLKNRSDIQIQVIGHTNGNKDVKAGRVILHSGEEWNFTGSARELSLRRAHKIVSFLQKRGIDPRNMEAKGMGGDQMIIAQPENMKEAMQNIRVEIIVRGG
ncbi:MAG: OmpA family protein [Vicingaceae bacterium]